MNGTWYEMPDGTLMLDGPDGWSRRVRVVPYDSNEGRAKIRSHGSSLTVSVTKLVRSLGLSEGDGINLVVWEDRS